jgi:hypothetical protein
MTSPDPAPPASSPAPRRLPRINLALFVAAGVLGTFWFLRHLEPWFTQVALIGGSVTLWAVLRLVLELLSKAGGVDPWAGTRKTLANPEWTLLLVVALVVLAALWTLSSSLYLRFDARTAKANQYLVSVGTEAAPAAFIASAALSATQPVVGRPVFGTRAVGPLVCQVVEPPLFEPRDCTLDRFGALSLAVPGDFAPRSFFLLRLVPAPALWAEVPPVSAGQPELSYTLAISVDGGAPQQLGDLRLQVLHTGSAAADQRRLEAQQGDEPMRAQLRSALLAEGLGAEIADQRVAQLMQPIRTWDGPRVKSGSKLSIDLTRQTRAAAEAAPERVPGFPIEAVVGRDAVQTLWIRPRSSP